MNIGDVSARSGLPAKTIRYYEDIGLVKPLRDTNGYRAFQEKELHKLAFLARSRALGFTIEDCRTLLALYEDETRASSDVKRIANQHLERIEAKISDLVAMRETLAHLVEECAGDHRPEQDLDVLDAVVHQNSGVLARRDADVGEHARRAHRRFDELTPRSTTSGVVEGDLVGSISYRVQEHLGAEIGRAHV